MTITTTRGFDITVTTRPAGKEVFASAFAPTLGRTPLWTDSFPAGTTDSDIEAALRAYLLDNTSMLD